MGHRYSKPGRNDGGFTLVELLIVLAIIAVLMGLLLPAVQSARESARGLQCSANMKQLGLAAHNFESTYGHLPSGISYDSAPRLRSWLFDLLPYLEQAPLYQQGLDEYEYQGIPYYHATALSVVPTFQCPSDPVSGQVHETVAEAHSQFIVSTNYLGVNGLNGRDHLGVIYANSKTRLNSISDGLSQTLLAGERPPSNDFWYGWWYSGAGYDQQGTGDLFLGVRVQLIDPLSTPWLRMCNAQPNHFEKGKRSQCDVLHFWSYHPGGAHFVRCDGGVQLVKYSQDGVIVAFATRNQGETTDSLD